MGPGMNLSGAGAPEQVRGVHVSEAYFSAVRRRSVDRPHVLARGRPAWRRARAGAHKRPLEAALRRRSGDCRPHHPAQLRALHRDRRPGADFSGEPETDLFLAQQADLNSPNQGHFLFLGARLKPGVTVAQADAQLRVVAGRFRTLYPGVMSADETFAAKPMGDLMAGGVRTPLFILLERLPSSS